MMTRRTMLWTLGTGLPLLLGGRAAHRLAAGIAPAQPVISKEDDAFLEELQRATFRFFADCANPTTGLVKDRHRVSGNDDRPVASIAATAWDAWKRPGFEYAGWGYLTPREPLFVHQYSHAWIDFRGRRDRHADYFENSVRATRAHRVFCARLAKKFPHFGENVWGITASDSRSGYVVWGGLPRVGTAGRLTGAVRGGWVAPVPARRVRALPANTPCAFRFSSVDALRFRGSIQPGHWLDRSGRGRKQRGHHAVDGGKRPNGFCLGDVHEKRGSSERAAKGWFPHGRGRSPSVRARPTWSRVGRRDSRPMPDTARIELDMLASLIETLRRMM